MESVFEVFTYTEAARKVAATSTLWKCPILDDVKVWKFGIIPKQHIEETFVKYEYFFVCSKPDVAVSLTVRLEFAAGDHGAGFETKSTFLHKKRVFLEAHEKPKSVPYISIDRPSEAFGMFRAAKAVKELLSNKYSSFDVDEELFNVTCPVDHPRGAEDLRGPFYIWKINDTVQLRFGASTGEVLECTRVFSHSKAWNCLAWSGASSTGAYIFGGVYSWNLLAHFCVSKSLVECMALNIYPVERFRTRQVHKICTNVFFLLKNYGYKPLSDIIHYRIDNKMRHLLVRFVNFQNNLRRTN